MCYWVNSTRTSLRKPRKRQKTHWEDYAKHTEGDKSEIWPECMRLLVDAHQVTQALHGNTWNQTHNGGQQHKSQGRHASWSGGLSIRSLQAVQSMLKDQPALCKPNSLRYILRWMHTHWAEELVNRAKTQRTSTYLNVLMHWLLKQAKGEENCPKQGHCSKNGHP